ncbi:MAG: stage III sporulation protein AE [Clostridiales bacterium]|nr:stage III sporulation protein AE [Clostridiales bacterium]
MLLVALLLMPTALALDQEEIFQEQKTSLGMDELEEAGQAYTGQEEIGEDLDVEGSFRHIAGQAKDALAGVAKASVRSCVLLLAVTLLCGLAEGIKAGTGEDGLSVTTLAAALSIAAIAVGDVHSLLTQGEQAIDNMKVLGDVLLPAVSMATAASGSPAMAVVKHGATILFSDFLIRLIDSLLIPLCYAFVAANVAWAALGNGGLKRLGGLLKWMITIILSIVLLVFVGYLNLSGVISGGADAATVKAAKFTISNLVPVVGGVISDTAETLLAGASVLRNAAGVFGMLAVLGICVVPFLNLGIHYLMYRCTAALAATVSGDGRITGLIEALGAAFGLILAMTASCAVLLVVAMVSAVSAVAG